ncbi:MAG: tetratricopeptide repeat protein, partial [Magnetospirillum sp.]|nr:tetratricopeptide repeat protein [Magnetospirillum sp.]
MAEIEDLELEFADLSEHAAIIEALWQEASLARRYGDLDPALDAYCRILEMDNGHAEAMLAAAEVCRLSGHSHDALQFCVDLLELEPRHIGGRLEMAENLRLLGQADDAHAIHDLLLLERPDSPHSWCGLARLLADEGKQSGAEACLRRALALDPAHAPAWAALGRGLLSESRVEEALDALHATLILEPECTAHHVAMTEALIALGRYDEARPHLDRALALDDEDVHARLAQAHLLALDGHLTQAFHEAQCRWHLPGRGRPLLPGCPWDGEDLEASTLLLHAEGNLGDTIRMARFLPILAERGARLVVMAPLALKTVLANLPGVEAVLPDDAPPPEDLEADYVAPLMDLPGLLGVELTSIPNASYLVPPPERIRTIRVPAHTQVKVGLAWVSDTAAGDVPLDRLLRLSCIPGILLFSLQTGPRAAEAPALAEPSLITDLSPTIADFADLAGRIAEMDVVITADCATAHLAAALGKPVWLMLAHAAAALWLRDRTDSPWYQDMVLLRQAVPGNWNTVMETVTSRLVRLRDQMAERD